MRCIVTLPHVSAAQWPGLKATIAGFSGVRDGTVALAREPFDHARDAVNAWRGRCLHAFSRAEFAVTESLLALSEVQERGSEVRLPHLVGQRFDALATAIGPEGPFSVEGKAAAKTLAAFRSEEDLRVLLCHGVGTVTLNMHGRWTLVLRLLALRARKPSRESRVIEEAEATRLADELVALSGNLCSQLGGMRARVAAKSQAAQ